MNYDEREFLSKAVALLDKRGAELDPPYWFTYEGADEGETYCYECLHELRPDAEPGDDYSGGYSWEADGCEICEKCEKLLQYTLTDYGVESELEHFVEAGLDWSSQTECYALARVAHGIYENDEQSEKLLQIIKVSKNYPAELQVAL